MSDSASRNGSIETMLEERIAVGDFPGAVYLVSVEGQPVFRGSVGHAVRFGGENVPCNDDTIFDIASLTKPLVTGLLFAIAIKEKKINPDDAISKFLPGRVIDEIHDVTIEQLATHTSGFAAWIPFYLEIDNTLQRTEKLEKAIDLILSKEPACSAGSKAIYSDLNFILLGKILELVFGEPLDVIANERIFSPLGLKRTFFNPTSQFLDDIAASEFGNRHERKTCEEMGYETSGFDWRDYLIRGEVHDGNCFFFEGVSGHAGLFSTVHELNHIALQFLPGHSSLLDDETIDSMTLNRTPELNEHRSLAFQIASTPDSTAGSALDPKSLGHLGFTGTSLWIDPSRKMIAILLTNRTHDHELPFVNIKETRKRFNELAAQAS